MVKRQIHRIGKLGLKVNISEMDVRVSKLETNEMHSKLYTDIRDIAQTEIYQGILTAALSEPAFDGIWLWGFTDRHTWVKNLTCSNSHSLHRRTLLVRAVVDGN